ncbi:DapH/DapD/GlmU-related protein [Bacillus sp. EB106-08-02-XG196]|uniref:acyltransferase n=1 Tax=Bacillus sp. EB106-08-02-XG196 TaxID=2737049 RepID=UPI001C4F7371|nr:acyltransferase [Bacillus sp. EB106-08-02-XG196]
MLDKIIRVKRGIYQRGYYLAMKKRFHSFGKYCNISFKSIVRGKEKISLGENCTIHDYALLDASNLIDKGIIIGNNTIIHSFTHIKSFDGKIEIGHNCTINSFCLMYGCEKGIKIGNGVRIATGASMVANSHVFDNPDIYISEQGVTSKGIIIEDDVWIASGVRIIDGVTVGKGSVIGANAVVTKDIPPYSIAVGVPAQVIRSRKV